MKSDPFSSAIFLGLSVLMAVGALNLDIGTASAPGPGMYPLLLAIAGIVFSLLLAVPALRNWNKLAYPPRGNLTPVLIVVGALAAFVALLQVLGLGVSVTLLMAVLFWVGRIRDLPRLAGFAIAFGLGSELACRLMGIPVPDNLLGQLLAGA